MRNYQVNPLLRLLFKGNKYTCSCCDGQFGWLLPHGREFRRNVLCPACGSLERHRLLVLYLKNRTNFFSDNLKVLNIAPGRIFQDICINSPNLDYISGDLKSSIAMVHFDIIDIPFPDNHFDCIFCYHVFEHVLDDKKAMMETYRVMKPGGWGILEVPYDPNLNITLDDPSITTPDERKKTYGYSNHYRLYGMDYKKKLEDVGFDVRLDDYLNDLTDAERIRYSLPEIEPLHICTKQQN